MCTAGWLPAVKGLSCACAVQMQTINVYVIIFFVNQALLRRNRNKHRFKIWAGCFECRIALRPL